MTTKLGSQPKGIQETTSQLPASMGPRGGSPGRRSLSVPRSLFLRPLLLVALIWSASAWPAGAQEAGDGVRDLTGRKLNEAELLEALRPRVEPPPLARSMKPPTCKLYRERMSRGFTVESVSEEVAITVEFASDSAELTPAAKEELDVLGAVLRTGELARCCFRVEGHTDSENTEEYNQALSERRAQSVVRYLSEFLDIDPDRLLEQAFGETQPQASNETPEGRQRNRRVEVTNLGPAHAPGDIVVGGRNFGLGS